MTTKKLKDLYSQRSKINLDIEKKYDQMLFINSLIRIALFALICLVIYFFWSESYVIAITLFIGVTAFLFLIKRQLRLRYQSNFHKALKELNEQEQLFLTKQHFSFPDGSNFSDPIHEYSQDIDLFGKGSFFQFLNRTKLQKASFQLAEILKANNINNIVDKQEAIKELSPKLDWRQEFLAEASLVDIEKDPDEILYWIKNYKSFVPTYMRYVALVFTILSCAVIAIYALGVIAESLAVLWLFVGLLISAVFVKKINALSVKSSAALTTFTQYGKLLKRIEAEKWEAKNITLKLSKANSAQRNGSEIIEEFARHLNALDQRSNIMISIFLNGFFLRDISCSRKIEKWIHEHAKRIEEWFDIIHYFDVQISLANFEYNHATYAYPQLGESQGLIEAKELGHPLLDEKKRINNDFAINKENFFIITGANMAGKSTFLRTVSLAIVMANIGLPVCAKDLKYSPTKLVTSMRTNDSLSDEESYFFSELKRLRFIIDRIQEESYFIILDEILKGTNSKDKAEGSKKFVERLVRSHSTGIIATHDLSLCVTADEQDAVSNYYFDAEIKNDELHFDYQLKEGVCKNMNASFLLRKMDIV